MTGLHRIVFVPALVCVAGSLALGAFACGGHQPQPVTTVTETTTPSASPSVVVSPSITPGTPGTMTVSLYFIRNQHVATVHRVVPKTGAPATAAIRALLAGSSGRERGIGLTTLVPSGTGLRSIKIASGVATIDLTHAFAAGGGTLSMTGRLAQVVYTLTQFATVQGVKFRLDGAPVSAFGSEGIDVAAPQTRKDYEDVTPAIFVESPAPFDAVSSPLVIRGTADVFEGTFRAQVIDGNGAVVAGRSVQATSGTGERGTFKASIPFAATTPTLTLRVYEVSMANGAQINVVVIPLARAK
jgi:hypothetical protein